MRDTPPPHDDDLDIAGAMALVVCVVWALVVAALVRVVWLLVWGAR